MNTFYFVNPYLPNDVIVQSFVKVVLMEFVLAFSDSELRGQIFADNKMGSKVKCSIIGHW